MLHYRFPASKFIRVPAGSVAPLSPSPRFPKSRNDEREPRFQIRQSELLEVREQLVRIGCGQCHGPEENSGKYQQTPYKPVSQKRLI